MTKKSIFFPRPARQAPWLVAAALLITVACGGSGDTKSKASDPKSAEKAPAAKAPDAAPTQPEAPAPDDRIEIPLDGELGDEEASLARNFYFIFDGSGSMRKAPGSDCRGDQQFPSKLAGAQWAVAEFLSKVPEDIHLGLYLFDSNGRREVVPLGRDNRAAFLSAINGVDDGGGTPLAQAIEFGVQQLTAQYKKQLGYGEYRLVVVTDGQAKKIPEAAEIATRYSFPIYAIGLCIGERHPLRTHAVSYRAADNFADLARGLEETLAELPSFDATDFDDVALEDAAGAAAQ